MIGVAAREEFVRVEGVHPPLGRYAHAVRYGRLIFISGCGPFDQEGRLVGVDDVATQCRQVLANARTILYAAGSSPARVVREAVYLIDVEDRFATRVVREEFYGSVLPSSTLVGVAALTDPAMRVEIDLVATAPRFRGARRASRRLRARRGED